MADDIALHFRRACLDCVSTRPQVTVRPESVVDGAHITRDKLAVGAEQFLSYLLQTLVEFAPEYLLYGTFWPGDARGTDAAEGAQLIQSHDFNFRIALREFLSDERISDGGLPMFSKYVGELDQSVDIAFEKKMQASAV